MTNTYISYLVGKIPGNPEIHHGIDPKTQDLVMRCQWKMTNGEYYFRARHSAYEVQRGSKRALCDEFIENASHYYREEVLSLLPI